MSKVIKKMQMDAMMQTFENVRDVVVLNVSKLSAINDNEMRARLASKKVNLFMVKNAFTKKIFREMGMAVKEDSDLWKGPSVLAWGCDSVGELSRVINEELTAGKAAAKYKNKVTVKGAIADGQEVTFDVAKKMPTREEAIATVSMMALAPASRVAGQLTGSAATLVGQIKQIAEPEGEGGGETEAEAGEG